MDVTLLSTGYWHVRLNRERFGQWARGTTPTRDNFFPVEWWTEAERQQAIEAVERHEAEQP